MINASMGKSEVNLMIDGDTIYVAPIINRIGGMVLKTCQVYSPIHYNSVMNVDYKELSGRKMTYEEVGRLSQDKLKQVAMLAYNNVSLSIIDPVKKSLYVDNKQELERLLTFNNFIRKLDIPPLSITKHNGIIIYSFISSKRIKSQYAMEVGNDYTNMHDNVSVILNDKTQVKIGRTLYDVDTLLEDYPYVLVRIGKSYKVFTKEYVEEVK